MKTKFGQIIKKAAKVAAVAALLGIGMAATTVSGPRTVGPVRAARTANTNTSLNSYWANRVDQYARQRRMYRHRSVNRNFRDIGGLPTQNGQEQIKPDHIFRSGNLHAITRTGVNTLHALHVKSDIELRYPYGGPRSVQVKPGPGEQGRPDYYGLHMHYIAHPVQSYAEEHNPYDERMYNTYGENYDYTNSYVLPRLARTSYHKDIIYIANHYHNNSAIMYNCTQGRDRTGVLSILLEHILGVSRSNIYNDFMLTNHYRYQTPYSNQVQRINDFYRTVDKYYRGINRYIRKGLRIHSHTIRRMRREYLEPIH